MAHIIEGNLTAEGKKIAIVASRFNEFITARLVEGAMDALVRHGVKDDDVTLVRVPGAFEIPAVSRKLALSGKFDGVIALGAVIRGGTPHFDYVCSEAAKGIGHLSMEADIPVIFGILTTDTIEQAIERAGTKAGNKGFETSMALVEMMDLYTKI